MPKYLYKCESCKHEFTFVQKITDKERLTTCPKCKTKNLYRAISPRIGMSLKGTGWGKDA